MTCLTTSGKGREPWGAAARCTRALVNMLERVFLVVALATDHGSARRDQRCRVSLWQGARAVRRILKE